MSWAGAVVALAGVLLATLLPGIAALGALGVRGLPLVALAPAVSTALLTGGAVLAGLTGAPWAWPAALLATALGTLVAWLIGRRWRGLPDAFRGIPRDRTAVLAGWVAAAAAALLATVPLWRGMHGSRTAPDTPDAEAHHALLRSVADTGRASPLEVVSLPDVGESGTVVRPGGWHDLVSAAVSATGADVVVAANLSALVLAGIVVPLGCGLAAVALVPGWRWSAAMGTVLGTAFVSLPTVVISYGTVWPFAWAMGLVPGVLGALLLLLRATGDRRTAALAWAVAAAGIAACDRRAFGLLAVLGLPLVAGVVLTRWRGLFAAGAHRRLRAEVAVTAAAALALGAAVLVLTADRPPTGAPTMSGAQAVGEALFDTPLSEEAMGVQTPAWLLGVLVVVGAFVAVRTPGLRAWVVSWASAVGLYALAASAQPASPWRRVLTSWWFDDPLFLAAAVPAVAVPLAVVALHAAAQQLTPGRPSPRAALVAGAAGLALVVLLSFERADTRQQRISVDYAPQPAAAQTP